jgi:hypothetical protein
VSEEKNGPAEQPAPTGALVPTTPAGGWGVLLKAGAEAVCSFDLKTPAGRELLQKCEEEPDKPVRELVNMELQLQHVYARVVDYTNPETGEVYPILRICLVDDKGNVHPCASDGVRDSLVRLMAGHGMPPWKKPIPVRIALKALKNSRQRLTLLEVFDQPKGGKRS